MFFLKEEKLQGKQVKIQHCRTGLVNTKTTSHPKIHSALGSVLTDSHLESFLQSNGWWKKDEDQSGSPVPAVFPLPVSCLPPNLLCTPQAHLLAGQYKKQSRSRCCPAIKKHPWVINTIFSTNPKHGPVPATAKKISSTPAKPPTTGDEVQDHLRNLEVDKFVGPNEIHFQVLKTLSQEVINPLSSLI